MQSATATVDERGYHPERLSLAWTLPSAGPERELRRTCGIATVATPSWHRFSLIRLHRIVVGLGQVLDGVRESLLRDLAYLLAGSLIQH